MQKIEYLTLREAAKQTGLHYQTLYRYVVRGRLKAERFNGYQWIIPKTELNKLIRGELDLRNVWAK